MMLLKTEKRLYSVNHVAKKNSMIYEHRDV